MCLVIYTDYLEKLSPHLCDVYKRTRFVPKQYLWPPNQPEQFKKLTFLRHDSQFKQKQLSHIAAKYRHANKSCSKSELKFDIKNTPMFKQLEEGHLSICKTNATKNIADLFSYEENLKLSSILVEGAPGVGKTELIKQIAYLWAKSELLHDMKLVFVLYLRDPSIHNLKSIETFIHQYINNENRYLSTKEAEGVIQELRDSRGSNIAFLMDGFDEFPFRVYGNSFVAGLIRGEVLPNALLLITSRPIASLFMHSQVTRVFDIVGFDKEEKEQYISESLRNLPEKQNELQQYLMKYPLINSYCYIPLHLSMVVFLLKNATLPETLTKVNELFILRTISHNLRQRSNTYKKLSLKRFTDLPSEIYNIVLQLSKLAYDGVQESKLVFTLEEIKQVYLDTDDDTQYAMNAFGLLQAVEHYNPLATEVTASFNFLHYSMQEYLAAFYISTLSDKDQYSIMVSVKPLRYALSPAQQQNTEMSSFWHNQFVFMWLMYVGITCAKSYAFVSFLCNSGFFATTGKAFNRLVNSLSIVQILHLFQCFVEANNVKACDALLEHIFRDGNICIKDTGLSHMPLFSHHMLSLVFFLTKSPKLHNSLQFINCFFLDDAMNTLEEYFLTYPKKASSIKSIHFENSSVVSKSEILGTIIKAGHVSNISIVNISNYDLKNMIGSLFHNRMLDTLNIQQMGVTDCTVELLMQHLSKTTVKTLNIANNICSGSGTKDIANFMSKNSTLQVLNISGNLIGMSEEAVQHLIKNIIPDFFELRSRAGVKALATALENNPPLLSLSLSNNCISYVKELAIALSCNKVLVSLDLSSNVLNCDNQSSFDVLGSALRINNRLRSLNISFNDISDMKMNNVVEALYYNKTIQSLDISSNELTSHITENLAHALCYNSNLTLLALGSNNIGDEGAIQLASALKQNVTLTSLYLRDNLITNEGAVAIAGALEGNKVLKKLDLSMNNISDKGVSTLCNAFYIKNALKVLFIVFNPVNNREIFTKFAPQGTTHYWQNHIPMTYHSYGQSVIKVNVNKSDKRAEYRQKLPVQATTNLAIWYATTNNKRTLVFTSEMSYYNGWKNCLYKNMYFQHMYAHASINHPNDKIEEECLQCYTVAVLNPL